MSTLSFSNSFMTVGAECSSFSRLLFVHSCSYSDVQLKLCVYVSGPSSAVAYNLLEYTVMCGNFTLYLSSGKYYAAAYIR